MDRGRPLHVISIVGDRDDRAPGARFHAWRPSLAICEQLRPAGVELLAHPRLEHAAQRLARDILQHVPGTRVEAFVLPEHDDWAADDAAAALSAYAAQRRRRPEELIVHLGTGTPAQTACLTLLVESGALRARFAIAHPPGTPAPPVAVFDPEVVRRDARAAHAEVAIQDGASFLADGVPTRNEAYGRLLARVQRIAVASRTPILLLGPTGCGKSQLARRLHDLRAGLGLIDGRFEAVNCATLRDQMAKSELFGHARGAYTGADRPRDGRLLRANGGTVFLDEVGELGLEEQAMLLTAIEEKTFHPSGADDPVFSDFMLVCATNRDLYADVDAGRFRADLLARIDGWTIELPGLKERPEDLEPILDALLARWSEALGRPVRFLSTARAAYLAFALSAEATWRANFRDLAGSVERMATLALDGRIVERDVAEELAVLRRRWGIVRPEASGAAPAIWPRPTPRALELLGSRAGQFDQSDLAELENLLEAASLTRNASEAGRLLFNVTRTQRKSPNDPQRVQRILRKFGLGRQDLWPSAADAAGDEAQGDVEGSDEAGSGAGSEEEPDPSPRC